MCVLVPGAASAVSIVAASPGSEDITSDGRRYDAVFRGDATGRKDVTSSLRAFLESHNGKHVALARNGVYRVTQMSFTARRLTIDFRGARIQGSEKGAHGIFRIQSSKRIVVNDPTVYGTGYRWHVDDQFEHGIWIDGGADITLNRPRTFRTRGDGIYVGYQEGKNRPPTGIHINDPQVEQAARNGIAPVAGQVEIIGGEVIDVGLHGINFEPSTVGGGASIQGTVRGVVVRNHGQLDTGHLTYAIAAGGNVRRVPQQPVKISMRVEDVTGDCLRMIIRDTATVIVRNNVSDVPTSATFPGSRLILFTGNVRITGTLHPNEACYGHAPDGHVPPVGGPDVPGPDSTLMVHNLLYWLLITVPDRLVKLGA